MEKLNIDAEGFVLAGYLELADITMNGSLNEYRVLKPFCLSKDNLPDSSLQYFYTKDIITIVDDILYSIYRFHEPKVHELPKQPIDVQKIQLRVQLTLARVEILKLKADQHDWQCYVPDDVKASLEQTLIEIDTELKNLC